LKVVSDIRKRSGVARTAGERSGRAGRGRDNTTVINRIENNTTVNVKPLRRSHFVSDSVVRQSRWRRARQSWRREHSGPARVVRVHRNEYVYYDRHHRLCHRIVRPSYRYVVYYDWGPWVRVRYVWPYYHRRYVFISLGGWWPSYRYVRYYWYGWHPYHWYGYYPIPYEVGGDTYNYYTYNYYNTVAEDQGRYNYGVGTEVDENTFADVRAKLAQQQAEEPEPETTADVLFDEAVQAFEANDFDVAAVKFAQAMEMAPDDVVLPYAYSQALFAAGDYTRAAEVLREALEKVTPDAEGVFYPRGLYANDDVLFDQIELLGAAADLYDYDADLQLLLGYHLLGIGQTAEALDPLERASADLLNYKAAKVLLDLAEKISIEQAAQPKPEGLVADSD